MKKFKIDLSEYGVEVKIFERDDKDKPVEVTKEIPYPLKKNLSDYLTVEGIFKGGMECCKAYDLSKQIKSIKGDEIILDEVELKLLTTAMDALIAQKNDPARGVQALGGKIHEICIRRVFQAEEVK